MKHKTVVKYFKNFGLSNALYGTEDDVLFDKSESLDNNGSNDDCDSSDGDFKGFYDWKLNTALPSQLVSVNLSFNCE